MGPTRPCCTTAFPLHFLGLIIIRNASAKFERPVAKMPFFFPCQACGQSSPSNSTSSFVPYSAKESSDSRLVERRGARSSMLLRRLRPRSLPPRTLSPPLCSLSGSRVAAVLPSRISSERPLLGFDESPTDDSSPVDSSSIGCWCKGSLLGRLSRSRASSGCAEIAAARKVGDSLRAHEASSWVCWRTPSDEYWSGSGMIC